MKEFLARDFLLNGEAARRLYYEHAEKMPIYDFHCHLSPKEIYEDTPVNWAPSRGWQSFHPEHGARERNN